MTTPGGSTGPDGSVTPGADTGAEDPQVGQNTCPDCGGTGRTDAGPCATCGGAGTVEELVGDA